jgi:hypothetical protein
VEAGKEFGSPTGTSGRVTGMTGWARWLAGPRGWRGQPVAYPTPLLLAGAGGGGSEWGVEALEANATIVGGTSQDRLQGAIDVGEPDLDQTRGA